LKLAISGKGGVGKTTLAAVLARLFARDGRRVFAVDADPDTNLALMMGYPEPQAVPSLAGMQDLIEERTGAKAGSYGVFVKLNPKVDDLPEKISVDVDGVRLAVMGVVATGGTGCACPENVLLKNFIDHLFLERDDVVIMDMEAGVEHLGRATARAVDAFLVVVEPSRKSVETAVKVKKLASDIGVRTVLAVGNKVSSDDERDFLASALAGIPITGMLPADVAVKRCDARGVLDLEEAADFVRAVAKVKLNIESMLDSEEPAE